MRERFRNSPRRMLNSWYGQTATNMSNPTTKDHNMKLLFALFFTMFTANVVCAIDFDNSLSQGRVTLKAQAAPTDLDTLDTASIGFYRIDNGERLLCANVPPGGIVSGTSTVINKRSGDIFLVAVAHTAADCEDLADGIRSDNSDDRYLVRFGKPGKPITVEIAPAS